MVLDRKWISLGAGLALATLAGPIVAFAADSSRRSYSSYTPSTPPPPVKQPFNSAASPSPKQKFNNASGSAAQSGKPSTSPSNQAGPKPSAQALMEAFRANAKDISNPKTRQNASPAGARGLHNSQESRVPDVNAVNPKTPPKKPKTWTGPGGPNPGSR
jgi:hypothetical protein